jgi:hypothetical protein
MRVPKRVTEEGGVVPDVPEGASFTVTGEGDDWFDIEPASVAEQVADLRARVEAVASLADKANATAQEVAQAARDARPPRP